jgi:hypothetical protein
MSLWYIPIGYIASKVAFFAWGSYGDREELRAKELDTEALIDTCKAMLRMYQHLENHPAETPMELLAAGVTDLEDAMEQARNGWALNYKHHTKNVEKHVAVLERRLDLFMRALRLPTSSEGLQRRGVRRARATEATDTL